MLYPAPLRDLLIEIAAGGLFRARWSNQIHSEWISSLLTKRADLSIAQLQRTRELMDAAIEGAQVYGFEPLIDALSLPDPDDRHVLAAAIHSGSDGIVTYNIRDFPADTVRQYEIEILHPDDFLTQQFGLDAAAVVLAAQRCRARLKYPPLGARDYLDVLRRQSLPLTTAELAAFADLI